MREEIASAGGRVENDDIWRGGIAIGFHRGGQAAHVHRDMRSFHPTIGRGQFDDARRLRQFAESVQGNAGHRRDLGVFRAG